MKKKMLLYVFLLVSINTFAQARLALTTNFDYSDAFLYKNLAEISNILLNQNGDEWYEENLLKHVNDVKNLKNIRFNLVISTCGYLKIAPSSNLTSEVRNAILNAFKIIEQKQIPLYYNWWYYDQLIRAGKSITARDLQRVWGQSSASVNFGGYFYAWFFLLPGNEIVSYKYYVEEEIASAREPLTYLEWLKAKINYYISCPIESSLDYGITNEVFCPNYNESEDVD